MGFKENVKFKVNEKIKNDSRVLNKSQRKKGEYAIGMFLLTCLMLPLFIIFGLIINLLSLYTDAYEKLSKKMHQEAKDAAHSSKSYTVE